MKPSMLTLVEGTSALTPSAQLETELLKDRWDARNIPGLRYAPHRDNYYIHFTGIPARFRSLVKDYVKFQFTAGRAAKTLDQCAYYLGGFFTFFFQRYPDAFTLQALSQQDIDAFIQYLKTRLNGRGKPTSDEQIGIYVSYLEGFLCYLERCQSTARPSQPAACIIWPHHYPRKQKSKAEQVKYIPQSVLRQLDSHLEHLPSSYIPIVILLRASGWRISDVLYLRWDMCLEQEGEKFSLVGDIQKTRVLGQNPNHERSGCRGTSSDFLG
jgi:hypothetical protein